MVKQKPKTKNNSPFKEQVKSFYDIMVKEDLQHLTWEEKNDFNLT